MCGPHSSLSVRACAGACRLSTHRDDYARRLAKLIGKAFEREVVVAFQQTSLGFQRVPDRTKGDGGLDGVSHGFTVGYCCYGLDLQPGPGTIPTRVRSKIVKKFTSDLLRIGELKKVKKKLVHFPNDELPKVFGKTPGAKLGAIRLISNVFQDKALIGDLKDVFSEIVKCTSGKFVSKKCELAIWGPEDVANNTSVNEHFLLRLEHPELFDAIEAAKEAGDTPAVAQSDFDAKFNALGAVLPTGTASVEVLRKTFRKAWNRSIVLNERLAASTPDLHRRFERIRGQAATAAVLASVAPGADPVALIVGSQQKLLERLAEVNSGGIPPEDRQDLAEAETGRLIGECPLNWQK